MKTKPVKYLVVAVVLVFLSLPLLLLLLTVRPTTSHRHLVVDNTTYDPKDIRIRPGYTSYEAYVKRQLNKTLDPRLREIWRTRDWERKIGVFEGLFVELKRRGLVGNESRALCVGARAGQEVEALRRVGVADSVGMDLAPFPPLVVEGDFHAQPFGDATFDFEFSNVFDHALYPRLFAREIERTLRPGGVCVLHVALHRRPDKYSANDLYHVPALVGLFHTSHLVRVRKVDAFGLDTEVVLRKNNINHTNAPT